MNELEPLTIFVNRMKRLGIIMTFFGNYPWIYIGTINGKKIKETFEADHGFTIGFYPIRRDQKFNFTDITEIFKLIRKYING